MSILYFLLLVGVLVVIHELGHFAAAKALDVKVLRFSLGYGRPLVRVKLRAGGHVSGRVVDADESGATIDVDGNATTIAYSDMRKARSRVEFGAGQ